MKVQACIFDLDGTLLDTLQDLANSVNEALADFNLPTRTLDEVRVFVGNGTRMLMQRAVPPDTDAATLDACYERFRAVYAREQAHFTAPYAGIRETLAVLREAGLRCAVLSNKNDDAVAALCEQYFPRLFDTSRGLREGVAPKPAPDSLLALCAEMHIAPTDAVYIGDSEVDLATAAAAHLPVIAVTWGFRSPEALRAAGATLMVHEPKALLPLLLDENLK